MGHTETATTSPGGTMPPPPAPPTSAPTPPTPPPPLSVAGRRALIAVAIVGQAALLQGLGPNLGSALLGATLGCALLVGTEVRGRSARALAVAAIGLSLLLPLRTEPALQVLTLVVVGCCLVGSAALGDGRNLLDLPADAFLHRFDRIARGIGDTARTRPRPRHVGAPARWGDIARGALLASPVVATFLALLSSADVVFGTVVARSLTVSDQLGVRLVLAAAAIIVAVVLLRTATAEVEVSPVVRPSIGTVEANMILGSVVVMFAAFCAVQVASLAGAADRILEDAGLTFKEYARNGFFQLLWVAGLSLVLVLVVHHVASVDDVPERRTRRVLRVFEGAVVALTLVLVAVAFVRLQLYIRDDALTPLRYHTSAFSIWIAVAFAVVALRVVGVRPDRAYVPGGLVITGLIALVAVSASDPGARIAASNVEANRASVLFHMEKLEADGRIVLIEQLDEFDPDLRADVHARLCSTPPDDASFLGWNLTEQRYADAWTTLDCGN